MLADTHAHIDFSEFDADRDEIISRAWSHKVRALIIPSIEGESAEKARTIAEKYPHIWFAVGFHPHDAKAYRREIIEKYCDHPKCVAIGEIGLDF